MMSAIFENIKTFFSKKENGEATGSAPEGMCPVCWGHNEWEGKYYEVVKDKHLKPGKDIYSNFISEVVDVHVNTTHKHENKYICTNCDKEIA
jgi:hypothetical protein